MEWDKILTDCSLSLDSYESNRLLELQQEITKLKQTVLDFVNDKEFLDLSERMARNIDKNNLLFRPRRLNKNVIWRIMIGMRCILGIRCEKLEHLNPL